MTESATAVKRQTFKQTFLKAIDEAETGHEITRFQAISLHFVALCRPAKLAEIQTLVSARAVKAKLMLPGADTEAFDWSALLAFIKELLPIIMQIIGIFTPKVTDGAFAGMVVFLVILFCSSSLSAATGIVGLKKASAKSQVVVEVQHAKVKHQSEPMLNKLKRVVPTTRKVSYEMTDSPFMLVSTMTNDPEAPCITNCPMQRTVHGPTLQYVQGEPARNLGRGVLRGGGCVLKGVGTGLRAVGHAIWFPGRRLRSRCG